MASLSKDGKVAFYLNGKKKSFRVSRLNKKSAQVVLNKVEQLLSYRAGNEPLPENLQRWLSSCDRWLVEAMANAGLCDPPCDVTIADYFDQFIRIESAKNHEHWLRNQTMTRNCVVRFFGPEVAIRDVSEDDAKRFRKWMETEGRPVKDGEPPRGYAEATIAQHVKITRKVFKRALKERIVHSNPFEDIATGSQSNPDRQFEIDRQTLEKLIDRAPNASWRLLILLVRIGGLRTGSETRSLKWENVDFVNRSIDVPGAKSSKRNLDGSKKIRWRKIPLYPELLEPLKDCFDPAEEFVLSGITGTDANVYNTFRRIVKKAGLTPWPRLWHNLRASRDSELSATGLSDHAVSQLMGNSPKVSRDHYKFITQETFESLKGITTDCSTDPQPVLQLGTQPPETADMTGNPPQLIQLFPGVYVDPEKFDMSQHPQRDSNPRPLV
jgi:integrase